MSDNSKDESTINAHELDGESHDEEQSQNQYESDVEKHFKSGMRVLSLYLNQSNYNAIVV